MKLTFLKLLVVPPIPHEWEESFFDRIMDINTPPPYPKGRKINIVFKRAMGFDNSTNIHEVEGKKTISNNNNKKICGKARDTRGATNTQGVANPI